MITTSSSIQTLPTARLRITEYYVNLLWISETTASVIQNCQLHKFCFNLNFREIQIDVCNHSYLFNYYMKTDKQLLTTKRDGYDIFSTVFYSKIGISSSHQTVFSILSFNLRYCLYFYRKKSDVV